MQGLSLLQMNCIIKNFPRAKTNYNSEKYYCYYVTRAEMQLKDNPHGFWNFVDNNRSIKMNIPKVMSLNDIITSDNKRQLICFPTIFPRFFLQIVMISTTVTLVSLFTFDLPDNVVFSVDDVFSTDYQICVASGLLYPMNLQVLRLFELKSTLLYSLFKYKYT